MTVRKVTFVFTRSAWSPTESYISGDWGDQEFVAKLGTLIELRKFILPASAQWHRVRVGIHNGERKSRSHRPGVRLIVTGQDGVTIPPNGSYNDNENGKNVDQMRSSLMVRRTFDNERQSNAYLSMVPDSIVIEEPAGYNPDGNAGWVGAMDQFHANLVEGGWTVYARKVTGDFTKRPVVKWISQEAAPSILGAVLTAVNGAPFVARQQVLVSGVRRRGTDQQSYNGGYFVDSVNATLIPGHVVVFLQSTETGDPATIKRPGKIQIKDWTYFPIQFNEPISGVARKRGNSAAQQRGSRRKRNTLDP